MSHSYRVIFALLVHLEEDPTPFCSLEGGKNQYLILFDRSGRESRDIIIEEEAIDHGNRYGAQ